VSLSVKKEGAASLVSELLGALALDQSCYMHTLSSCSWLYVCVAHPPPPAFPLHSEPPHDPREEAAGEAALAVALAVEEDGVASLVSELLGALEDVAGRALGAARLVGDYARATKHDLEDHVDDLLTVSADS
jgi:hypothetical protein